MTIHHRIASYELFILLTCLVLGTPAIQVETLPPVPCPEFQHVAYVMVESSCSFDKIGCPDEGGANSPVTTCYCELDGLRAHSFRENARAIVPCTSAYPDTLPKSGEASFNLVCGKFCDGTDATADREQSSHEIFECDNNASAIPSPLVQARVGDSCSPFSVCNEIARKYEHEKECFCSDGQFHCKFNECSVSAGPATQPDEGDACSEFSPYMCTYGELCCTTEAKKDDDAVPPRPVLSKVVRHDQRRRKRDKGEKRRKKNGGVMRSRNSRKRLPEVASRDPISAKAVDDGFYVSCVMSYEPCSRSEKPYLVYC